MCKMLLSINPEHVENILRGGKTYEYRKILCKRKVDKIVIYSTCPVKRVVGEVIEYDEPQFLDDIGVKMAPQSFMYLPEKAAEYFSADVNV